jgi:hypothetical protein
MALSAATWRRSVLGMPAPSPVLHITFDESHSEAWTIRPEAAAAMQPSHPGDASYATAADLLRGRRMDVTANTDRALTGDVLDATDVLVIAHPSDPRFERTTGLGEPTLGDAELDAIEAFVANGGGLVVMGEEEQDKYGNNLNALLGRFGVEVRHDAVQDYGKHRESTPSWVLAELGSGERGAAGDLLARVHEACFYRAGSLAVSDDADAQVFARTSPTASTPDAPLAVAVRHGKGRVVAFADSDLFGDDCIGALDHAALWENAILWAGAPALAAPSVAEGRGVADTDAWQQLKREADALRLLQEADGSVDTDAQDADAAAAHVAAMVAAIRELAPSFPHEADYLEAVTADLDAWVAAGYPRPDFTKSLDLFRPDLHREDGIEHLVVFPMYTQNGSPDTRFEALVVGVPWGDWVAELERTRFDNAKYIPVTLVDYTLGYDSECAVLFPETVAIAGKPANHFGGIFCDREAERFRRIGTAAADLLGLNVPPDAAALLASPELSQDAFELWDLIHDRAHSHGDLPFDPFMIRQRMPYWMYSLEELRCDLTAFGEAVKLEAEGNGYARDVQYTILFDRLFRFPVTGSRVRNYDGLGGQLLFAWLHKHGVLHWTDNRMTIEWERVADQVVALREAILDLYRDGITRSKLAQWGAAHDLVATYVPAAAGSRWVSGVRDYADVEDPRPYIDEVLPDEFPLSMFYTQLKAKIAPAMEARPSREAVTA